MSGLEPPVRHLALKGDDFSRAIGLQKQEGFSP